MPDADDRREVADANRIEADVERVEADTNRVEVDTDRRDQADTDRITADTARGVADDERAVGDVLRVEQDAIRKEDYDLRAPTSQPRVDQHFASFTERAILIGVAMFLIGGLLGMIGGWTLYRAVVENREASYEGRAVDCRILVAHNLPVRDGGPCDHPEVLKYYNPDEKPVGP